MFVQGSSRRFLLLARLILVRHDRQINAADASLQRPSCALASAATLKAVKQDENNLAPVEEGISFEFPRLALLLNPKSTSPSLTLVENRSLGLTWKQSALCYRDQMWIMGPKLFQSLSKLLSFRAHSGARDTRPLPPFACPAACHPGLKIAVGDAGAPWARELEREPVFKSGLQVMHRNMWCALLEAVSLLHPVVWRIRGDHIADISSHSSTVCNVELSN